MSLYGPVYEQAAREFEEEPDDFDPDQIDKYDDIDMGDE